MRQFTIGIERELFKDASFSVTYINRTYHNFQEPWIGLRRTTARYDTTRSDPVQRAPVDKTITRSTTAPPGTVNTHGT